MSDCTVSIEKGDCLVIVLDGKIDSNNSCEIEAKLMSLDINDKVVIDAEKLSYISSAGLRILLKLKKKNIEVEVINVHSDVYEVFEMTGFSSILKITKAMRNISIEGCSVIGHGGNGTVYRLDGDTIVKVFRPGILLDEIKSEIEFARNAFIQGIPTAIPYDVVKCGDSYGNVYELLNSDTLSKAFAENEANFDIYIEKYVALVKQLGEIHVDTSKFSSIKQILNERVDRIDYLMTSEELETVHEIINSMRDSDTLIHGDLHPGNIMIQNGELMLIDMADITVGPHIYDLVCLYRDLYSAPQKSPEFIEQSVGMKVDLINKVWNAFYKEYMKGSSPEDMEKMLQSLSLMTAFNSIPMLVMGGEEMVKAYGNIIIDQVLRKVILPNKDVLITMLKTL